ncbi:MAG TPA: von Willebrand factor type A domain-containing protein [Opitutus sp.]|nr:von Willebrand factor type A domain-containing protein [Opitutus sp.]
MNETKNFADDPKLTAYALGELEGAERAEVEAALRDDPAACAAVEEIRALAARMETALAGEAAADRMTDAEMRRGEGAAAPKAKAAIVAGEDLQKLDGGPRRRDDYERGAKSKLLRFPQIYFLIGGLAAAGFAVLVALHEPEHATHEPAKKYREVSLVQPPVASMNLPVANAATASGAEAKDRSRAPEISMATGLLAQAKQAQQEKTIVGAPIAPTFSARPPERESAARAKRGGGAEATAVLSGAALTAQTEKPPVYVYPRDDKFVVEAQPAPKVAAVAPALSPEKPVVLSPFEVNAAPNPGFQPAQTLAGTRLRTNVTDAASAISVVTGQFLRDTSEVTFGTGERRLFGMGSPRSGGKAMNTEAYAYRAENGFLSAADNPLSTFSADVDTASYANVRRFLESGQRPPVDAVRIEELLNYFPYGYAGPEAPRGQGSEARGQGPELRAESKTLVGKRDEGVPPPFAASMEVAEAPWAAGHRLVRIGLKGRDVAASERGAANLVFLLDVSGSMNEPNKLPLVQESMRMLLGRLRPDDHVAIVVYAGASGLALPSTPVAKAREIAEAIDGLNASGSTNGAMGIQLAYDIAKANFVTGGINRVILCTDGDFNVGVTSEGELVRLIQEKAKSGVFLTVLGFGMGNYKDATLQQLADAGNGNYGYVDSRREAEKLLVEQVSGTLVTIAKDVKLQVEFNPAQVASYRLIGYEKRLLKKEDFNNDKVDAGEIGAGHTVTALYEIVPVGSEESAGVGAAAADELKYQRPRRVSASVMWSPGPDAAASGELLTLKVRYKEPAGDVSRKLEFPLTDRGEKFADASADFKFAAAVAEFGMILRDSPNKGVATLADVRNWAEAGASSDPGGYRAEFVGLVRKAEQLMP